jgi:hypothetical protein
VGMNDWRNNWHGGRRRQTGWRVDADGRDGTRAYSPEEIYGLWNTDELRLGDNPSYAGIARLAMNDPNDPDIHELLGLLVRGKAGEALASGDPFWGNYPPRRGVQMAADSVVVGTLPTGQEIGFAPQSATANVGILGATGRGKSTLLKKLVVQLAQGRCVVTVEKKKELRHLSRLPGLRGRVTVLKYTELILSLVQPPPGVSEQKWATELTKVVAGCYGRQGAERLMLQILMDLLASRKPSLYPTLRELVAAVDEFKPRFGMREAAYKESIEWVLQDMLNSTDGIFDYSSSDLVEKLFSSPGLTIIEAETLPAEHYLFLVTYLMRWLYVHRLSEKERE